MRDHIPAFEQHLATRLSSRTIKSYGSLLTLFADFIGDVAIPTLRNVEAFLARRRADGNVRAPGTRNQELAALRTFAKFALRDLGWTENPTEGVPFVRDPPRDPPVLSVAEVRGLFLATCETKNIFERVRNLAILAVLSQAGLRVHELVALNVAQVDYLSATLIGIKGKGNTSHDLPLNAPTLALITVWLTERTQAVSPAEPALFVSHRGRRISIRSVQRMFVALRGPLGTAKKISPHSMRHTTATLALTLGSDLSTVAELMRHSSTNTTRRYLHLIDERRREAMRRLGTAIPAELIEKPMVPAIAELKTAPPERRKPLDAQDHLYDIPANGAPDRRSDSGHPVRRGSRLDKEVCR
jgi:integrase/recombinase XerC